MTAQTSIRKYFDGRGNIGELETYQDDSATARLMRPGTSNSYVGVSSDGKVGILHDHGRHPDMLYDRFDGSKDAAIAWLATNGFRSPEAR